MKAYLGSGCVTPHILDLGIRWWWVVRFTPRPLYPQEKRTWCPFYRRLGGPQSQSGCGGKKVKLSLCFNWAPRHEGVLGEWRYISTHSLTSALDGGERSASRHGRFTPRETAPGTLWTGGWVGLRAVLEAVVKRKIPSPCRESKLKTPIVQSVA
jgi:hypothetical protein